ncbi:MAG TPA: hypothetical protein VGT78_06365 [Rhizomicrobium sp.]|nr:hypothetical protein [Rhizomicrobium sp.]
MKKALLAASIALAVMGGTASFALADPDDHATTSDSDRDHSTADRDRDHTAVVHHWWWHHRWYDTQPAGYVYVAPPHPYEDAYWHKHWRRYHHCRDWDQDGDCH